MTPHSYQGSLKLVILDIAGTIMDFGSRAPAGAFVELFARHHVTITDAQARGPMGSHKRDHIATLCALPDVSKQWQDTAGRTPNEDDIEALYEEFIPLQIEALPRYTRLIPGACHAVTACRAAGLRIAFTTGYSKEMTDIVVAAAAQQGLIADTVVCASDVEEGRPAPWMAFECMRRLGKFPPAACLKFGDTIADIKAGRNAGMWSIGAGVTGNMVGHSEEEWKALSQDEQTVLRQQARESMLAAGAHAVVDGISELPLLASTLNHKTKKGDCWKTTTCIGASR